MAGMSRVLSRLAAAMNPAPVQLCQPSRRFGSLLWPEGGRSQGAVPDVHRMTEFPRVAPQRL